MPTKPPKPFGALETGESRFGKFMKRNIVVIAICAPLAVIALVAFIFQH